MCCPVVSVCLLGTLSSSLKEKTQSKVLLVRPKGHQHSYNQLSFIYSNYVLNCDVIYSLV